MRVSSRPGPDAADRRRAPVDVDRNQARAWRELADIGERLRQARTVAEIEFVLANETWRLLPYRQAVVYRTDGTGRDSRCRLATVSGLAALAEETPNTIWLKRLGRWLARGDGPEGETRVIGSGDAPAQLATQWPSFFAPWALVVPIVAPRGDRIGQLVLGLDGSTSDDAVERVQRLAAVAGHAITALRGTPRRPWPAASRRLLAGAVMLALLAVLLVPVRLSVLAPAEIVAWNATAVSAPMDGVIRSFAVAPQQRVRRDDPLFSLDDTTLANRREVASRQLQVARADALAAAQKAFASDASRAELAALNGRVAERRAELEGIERQLERITVRAPADGIVLFGDVNDWQGKPVVTGERIALLADPAEAAILIWLPVADAISIEPGADVRLFLQTAPLSPLRATVAQTSYQAVLSPDGIASYRLRARFAAPAEATRIGLRGTAKLYGGKAPLGYYLLRRPVAALRQWIGW